MENEILNELLKNFHKKLNGRISFRENFVVRYNIYLKFSNDKNCHEPENEM